MIAMHYAEFVAKDDDRGEWPCTLQVSLSYSFVECRLDQT